MKKLALQSIALAILIAITTLCSNAQPTPSDTDPAAIRAVIDAQAAAWNAGDLDRFMQAYDDSPQTTFIGHAVRHGYAELHAFYKEYFSKEEMGTLTFSDLDVRMLCPTNAVVTGRYKLAFSKGAAPQSGIFSLVWAKKGEGWKIVLDHSS